MKKVFLGLMALLVLSANQVLAYNFDKFTDDYKVTKALEVLEEAGSLDVFERLEQNKVRIMFYDLTLMSYSYANHYAVASTDNYGDDYILINSKYRNSPVEAIACLIAHESVHVLPKATLEEEVAATTVEAKHWIKLKSQVTSSVTNKLTQRLNNLEKLYKNSTPGHDLIKISIANNSFYQHQLALK